MWNREREQWKLFHTSDLGKEYYVSSHGSVKVLKPNRTKPEYSQSKTGQITINVGNKRVTHLVKHLVVIYFGEGYDSKLNQVFHIDGDTSNNYYKNLEVVTRKEGAILIANRRKKSGKSLMRNRAKLDEVTVSFIKRAYNLKGSNYTSKTAFCNAMVILLKRTKKIKISNRAILGILSEERYKDIDSKNK